MESRHRSLRLGTLWSSSYEAKNFKPLKPHPWIEPLPSVPQLHWVSSWVGYFGWSLIIETPPIAGTYLQRFLSSTRLICYDKINIVLVLLEGR